MTTVQTTPEQAREAIARMVRGHPDRVAQILRDRGAQIVADAAVLTPADTGYLLHNTRYEVGVGSHAVSLTIYNPTIYAHYQHERVMNHPNKATARDHYISIPFEATLPDIIQDIVDADIQEATRT